MSGALQFPVPTAALADFLPHRPPAVWIDEVTQVGADDGECRVRVDLSAHYADGKRIRESSFVEWIAQAYGYVGACQVLSGLFVAEKKPGKTFLVQIRDLEVAPGSAAIRSGECLLVRVKRTHRLGPFVLVEGRVLSEAGALLAQAKLKVFSD